MAREIFSGRGQGGGQGPDVIELTKKVQTLETELAEAKQTIKDMSTAIERGLSNE